jgi:hypothetical protein
LTVFDGLFSKKIGIEMLQEDGTKLNREEERRESGESESF